MPQAKRKPVPQRRKVHKRKPVPQPPAPTTALAVNKPPEKSWLLTQDEVTIVKNSIAKGASDQELQFCLTVARRYKLDPFKQQIWFVKRWDSGADNGTGGKGAHVWTPQVGINGLLYASARDHKKDFGSVSLPEYGPMITWQGTQAPEWAKVKVWKKGADQPTEAQAWWSEYAPADMSKAPFWRKMPRRMIGKCATALAIRQAYPDLGGLYIPEECEKMAEGYTEAGRQIVEGPVVGSREAAQDAGRRVYEEKKRQIEERAKEITVQPEPSKGGEVCQNVPPESGPTSGTSPKKIISISMPSDAAEAAHVYGDLDAAVIEHIKGPCLGIKLQDKDIYVIPVSHVVVLEAWLGERTDVYRFQEVSGLPSPTPKDGLGTPVTTVWAPEAAAIASGTNPKGASHGQDAPAAVTGKVMAIKPNQVSQKSKKQYYAVLIQKTWLYAYRTTLWPILEQCKGREVTVTLKDKVIQGFRRVDTRLFDEDGVTPIVQSNEERPKGGKFFV